MSILEQIEDCEEKFLEQFGQEADTIIISRNLFNKIEKEINIKQLSSNCILPPLHCFIDNLEVQFSEKEPGPCFFNFNLGGFSCVVLKCKRKNSNIWAYETGFIIKLPADVEKIKNEWRMIELG
jgi:hypothetical protein